MKSIWLKIALMVIFLLSFLLLIFSAKADSITTDEGIHLFAGYTYLAQGDFRLDPEHPPLLKEMAALPLLLTHNLNIELGSLWQNAGNFYYDSWQEARTLSENFLFNSSNNADAIVLLGRLVMIILTLILGAFAYFWAKKLYGEKAGVLAAFLTLFFPNILAHGHLINTDIGLTLFIFIAVYFWGEYLKSDVRRKIWINFVLAGLFSGLALASKYTAIILFVILLVMAIVKLVQDKKQYSKVILGYFGVLIMTFVVIWVTYGFSLQTFPKVPFSQAIKQWPTQYNLTTKYDNLFEIVRPVLIPPQFYKGIVMVTRHATGGHGAFLLGHNSNSGWWYYFPIAIIFKTPIPIFIFLALTIIYYKKIKAKVSFDELLLILPPVIYLSFAMYSKADLGIRHILPIFPFIFVFISKSINTLNFSKNLWLKIVLGGSILWYLVSTLISFPNYLAYFNEFALGPKNGYKILSDSNLDWGQDIFRIRDYINKNNLDPVYLVYPWDGDAALNYYGINFIALTPDMQNVKGSAVVSATYYNTDAYAWLRKFPFKEITPGVFLVEIN